MATDVREWFCSHENYNIINRLVSLGETKNTSETLLSITRKSNTGKVIRHLPAYIYTKHS